MFRSNDLLEMDVRGLSRDALAWEFFDVAPYDSGCCGLTCSQGLTAFTFSCVSAWGDVVVFACSARCIVERIEFELNRLDYREVLVNGAYSVVPAGECGSFRVIKPVQSRLLE